MKALFLLLVLSATGCSYVRNIPAESSPVRTERYYHSQDIVAISAGLVADQALSYVIKGPNRSHGGREWAPVIRLAVITTGALVWRQTDKGYRESGAMFISVGAMVNEIRKIAMLALTH